MKPPSKALERFALKAHHYGRISGVSLAAHAIPDAFLLLHTGVGCKYKAAAQISIHDWAAQPHRREGWTEVGDGALIRGAAARIGPYLRSWYDRQRPGLLLVCSSSFLEMTGEDVAAATREAAASIPCPVAYIPGFGFTGDLYEGYGEVIRAVLELVDWSVPAQPGSVSLVGYLHDRHEADHQANIHQLRGLLAELGLTLDSVLLGGQPLSRLRAASRSGLLVALPLAHRMVEALEATGREVVSTGLPQGVRGTSLWLEEVGRAAGVDGKKIAQVTSRLAGYAEKGLEALRGRTLGMRSALFAETPAAVGWGGLLEELGLPPRLVGLRDRSFGGAEALREGLGRQGAPLREDAEVLEDPSFWLVGSRLARLLETGALRVVVGSAGEAALARSLAMQRQGSQREHGAVSVITGFPSTGYHVIHPAATLGYGGAIAQGQRLLDALFGGSLG
ncbi:MAG: nitrogenase component 1 [Polyangia bacterium]|jgi:nitrogenase molybdenum-iron protein alpha/beta subunit|nr:nitrogenase component 1 [Polyangia bacterium]